MTLDSQLCSELWLSVNGQIQYKSNHRKIQKKFLESAATTSKASHPVIIHRNRFQLSSIHLIGDNNPLRFPISQGTWRWERRGGKSYGWYRQERRDCPCFFFFVFMCCSNFNYCSSPFHPPCHRWLPWLGLFFWELEVFRVALEERK